MSECEDEHRYREMFAGLPHDQGRAGRHACAGCAYELGFGDGLARREELTLGLDELPRSQAGTVRHRSPHAAYAKGYYDGVSKSYGG